MFLTNNTQHLHSNIPLERKLIMPDNIQKIINKLTPFEIQIIDDLWEDYIYNVRELNDADVDQCDPDDVGYFREWLDENTIEAFARYLPESDSELAIIIKYCVEHTVQ